MAHITHIEVSRNKAEEQELMAQGFKKINVNLNQWFGNPVYIWYKSEPGIAPITRIQVSFEGGMSAGLIGAGYIKIHKRLPAGSVFLWYIRGKTSFDTPIVDLEVSTDPDDEALKMKFGWQRVGCNLGVSYVGSMYLWMKTEKPTHICDVKATNSFGSDATLFEAGYIRIDETTNTLQWENSTNFIWYCLTTDTEQAVTDLKISVNNDQYQQYQQQHYTPVSVNLNEGSEGNLVYLWYKKDQGLPPVQNMLLLQHKSDIPIFKKAGASVIQENINCDNKGPERFLCYLKKQ